MAKRGRPKGSKNKPKAGKLSKPSWLPASIAKIFSSKDKGSEQVKKKIVEEAEKAVLDIEIAKMKKDVDDMEKKRADLGKSKRQAPVKAD